MGGKGSGKRPRWCRCADCGKNVLHHGRGKCQPCYKREYNQRPYVKAKKREVRKKRYATDPEFREKQREANRLWREKNPERWKALMKKAQKYRRSTKATCTGFLCPRCNEIVKTSGYGGKNRRGHHRKVLCWNCRYFEYPKDWIPIRYDRFENTVLEVL
jgi:hypothetical protein